MGFLFTAQGYFCWYCENIFEGLGLNIYRYIWYVYTLRSSQCMHLCLCIDNTVYSLGLLNFTHLLCLLNVFISYLHTQPKHTYKNTHNTHKPHTLTNTFTLTPHTPCTPHTQTHHHTHQTHEHHTQNQPHKNIQPTHSHTTHIQQTHFKHTHLTHTPYHTHTKSYTHTHTTHTTF